MSNAKVIINIFGPSTAGKSTIANELQEHIKRLYTVDFDVVKRQISGYHWQQDGPVATEITYDTLVSAANTELPVLALLPPPTKQAYDRISNIAKASKRNLINIEITAPDDVLIERYQERLRQVQESGSAWKFKTLDEFKEKLRVKYHRPEDTYTFNSATSSPDKILAQIKDLIG